MKGTKSYRFESNPTEKLFHDKFIERFTRDSSAEIMLSHIIFGTNPKNQNYPVRYLSDEEKIICVNLIQWLGSPVGMGFLSDCNFTELKNK